MIGVASNFLMLSLILVAVGSLTVILRFDGSLRPPRDPIPGFTYSSNVFTTNPLIGSEKLASCSATISASLNSSCDNDRNERDIALGGTYLPNTPGITSADTEYEGLLLGLEWLVNAFSSDASTLNEWKSRSEDPKLIIRGDCKTVIDQLQSRSIPRKMEGKYNLALDRIETLKSLHAEYHHADASISKVLSVHFEHIPREDNYFCDAICKLVINQKQANIVESINNLIQREEDDAKNNADECNHRRRRHRYSETRHREKMTKQMNHPKSDNFYQAYEEICHTSQLCHSSRLALVCELAKESIRKKDAVALDNLSSFFLKTSSRWSRIFYGEDNRDSIGRNTLRRVSTSCANLSKTFTGIVSEEKDISFNDIESVFEFCVNRKSQNDLNSPVRTILHPYTDVSELIHYVRLDSEIRQLQQWKKVYAKRDADAYITVDSTSWVHLS
mmetsp:Transcript_3260/g.8313  ORF Transcript_3260/g.8313 Transcript_3260/m.8313 type:complete len:445 (+) Transcript_3260:53-1387(+)